MGRNRYVALIRGINVGGRNRVAMADLRAAFQDAGYQSVSTYIQSGNVLFETDREKASLEQHVETALERRLGIPLVVVVRSRQQLRSVVSKAPPGFGSRPDAYHSDVVFLKAPLTPRRALGIVQLRDGVDQAWAANGVIYFARLSAKLAQSKLPKLAAMPEYRLMTIRSWSTTTKLLDVIER